jgi:hypothetical protein
MDSVEMRKDCDEAGRPKSEADVCLSSSMFFMSRESICRTS